MSPDLKVRRGTIHALIGPNGAGKTTVFNCITGFYKPTEGMMTLKRKNGETYLLERMPDFVVNREAKVARTFQNIRLFSGLTLLENLLIAQHNALMKASGYTIMGLFGIIIAMDILTGLLALFVLKPWRSAWFGGTFGGAKLAPAE